MRQTTPTTELKAERRSAALIKVLIPLALVSLFAWGCSDSPTSSADITGSSDAGATTGATEPSGDFSHQLNAVINTAAEDGGGQSDAFKKGLENLVTEAQTSEESEQDVRGAQTKQMQSMDGSAKWFWANTIDGPTTITRPGFYFVTSDFSTDGDGIVIKSDYVLLWLGGHTLTGPGAKEGRGVVVDGGHAVAVIGGRLRNFGIGVAMLQTKSSIIRWCTVYGADEYANPGQGIAPQIGIMLINSPDNLIQANSIREINLGIFVRGGYSMYNHIAQNVVVGGDHGLLGICYNPAPTGGDAAPSHDLVRFNSIRRFPTGIQTKSGAMNNRFVFNQVYYFVQPFEDLNGSNEFFHNFTRQIPGPGAAALNLSFDGLKDLGPDYVYEGWVIVNGAPVSTGRFTVDGSGNPSQTTFWVNSDQLAAATKFVLTIEPADDPDPGPSHTHYLGGDFSGSSASLSVADPAAFGSDFSSASGGYILATPSTGSDNTDYAGGIWWLDPMAGPGPSLSLPTLPDGWAYEGWVVGSSGPITTGKFTDLAMADSDGPGPAAGPDMAPPFPGQDFVNPFMSLIGEAAVITIEPMPDNSPAPFGALKPLVDGSIDDVGRGVIQDMMNNAATFPTGSASR